MANGDDAQNTTRDARQTQTIYYVDGRFADNSIDTLLDMGAIRAKYWKDENDLDLKQRKEAEFLFLGDIPVTSVLGCVVYNEVAKKSSIILELTGLWFIFARNFIFRS